MPNSVPLRSLSGDISDLTSKRDPPLPALLMPGARLFGQQFSITGNTELSSPWTLDRVNYFERRLKIILDN